MQMIEALPNGKTIDQSDFKSICGRQNSLESKIEMCVWKVLKHFGKKTKGWLPVFSPFPTRFRNFIFKSFLFQRL